MTGELLVETNIKKVIPLTILMLAMANIGGAQAQSASTAVATAVTTETSRIISDAASQAAQDALKSDHNATGMTKKAEKTAGKANGDVKKAKH